MNQNEYVFIQENLVKYQYNSMNYTEYEDVEAFVCLRNDKNLVLLIGFDEESGMRQIHWASNSVQDLIEGIKYIKTLMLPERTKLSFVPKEWVKELTAHGFDIYAIWHDYWLDTFDSCLLQYDNETLSTYECLAEKECAQASAVTMACKGLSRGFTGQSESWIREWMNGTEDSATASGVRDTAILIHRDEIGTLDGILCTGIYGDDNPKGPVCWIREIAVLPEAQRKGIGRQLLLQAITYGKQHGATRSFLAADECNAGAIHLYEKVGFIPSIEEPEINLISVL